MSNNLDLSGSLPLPTATPGQVGGAGGTHKTSTGFSSTDSISSAGGMSILSVLQASIPDLSVSFSASVENRMQELCIGVLNQWCESVKKDIEEEKKETKSADYQNWLARQGKKGFEAYLNSLTPEQRFRVQEYPNLERNIRIGEGGVAAMENYTRSVEGSNDPAVRETLSSITAAVIIGGGVRFDSVASDGISGTLIPIQPVRDANNSILIQMAPNQAAELGYLGALFANAAAFSSLRLTINSVSPTEGGAINLDYARHYATTLLKSVNSSEFNSFCMTILAHSLEGGEPLTRDYIDQLVKQIKVVILATALALLYKMEGGGGIAKEDFLSLVHGKINSELLSKEDKDLIKEINILMKDLPGGEEILNMVADWVDTTKDNKQLINVEPLISNKMLPNPEIPA